MNVNINPPLWSPTGRRTTPMFSLVPSRCDRIMWECFGARHLPPHLEGPTAPSCKGRRGGGTERRIQMTAPHRSVCNEVPVVSLFFFLPCRDTLRLLSREMHHVLLKTRLGIVTSRSGRPRLDLCVNVELMASIFSS